MKSPEDYRKDYLTSVYDGAIPKQQWIEVGCAFHAGIEAVFKFTREHITTDMLDEDIQKLIATFRNQNRSDAAHVNLSRFSE
jgi:hypothetical protein